MPETFKKAWDVIIAGFSGGAMSIFLSKVIEAPKNWGTWAGFAFVTLVLFLATWWLLSLNKQ